MADFDLSVLDDGEEAVSGVVAGEVAVKPENIDTLTPAAINNGDNIIVFDVETGPRPWDEIEKFYEPPEKLPPFNESMVAYGNTKDEAKRAAKRAEVFAIYQAKLANEGRDREQHWKEFVEKAALSPKTGRILAIGLQSVGEEPKRVLLHVDKCGDEFGKDGEEELLSWFWLYIRQIHANNGRAIGFNIQGFDLPFLIRRSWLLDVEVPDFVIKGRYFSSIFEDLMVVWACCGREFVSLDDVAKYFGIGGKPDGVNGGMFAELYWNKETRQKALDYLGNDLAMTAGVARKMGVC